jgi:hypothetical protein
MVRISETTSAIRTKLEGGRGREGVKGQDERQTTAPLTPSRPPRETACGFCLTRAPAVIHGARSGGWEREDRVTRILKVKSHAIR